MEYCFQLVIAFLKQVVHIFKHLKRVINLFKLLIKQRITPTIISSLAGLVILLLELLDKQLWVFKCKLENLMLNRLYLSFNFLNLGLAKCTNTNISLTTIYSDQRHLCRCEGSFWCRTISATYIWWVTILFFLLLLLRFMIRLFRSQ